MSPETRDFLDQIRDAEDPPPEAQQRVLSALSATVVAGSLGAGAYGWAKLFEPLSSLGISGLKLGAVALCVLAVSRSADPPRTEPTSAQTVSVVESKPREAAPPPPPSEPAPALTTPARPAARPSLKAVKRTPSLRDELSLLTEVRAALQRGDGVTALRLLDRHDTSDRQLLAERAAARVLALCASGKTDEAREAAAEFARRHPGSLQLSAVARSCAGER